MARTLGDTIPSAGQHQPLAAPFPWYGGKSLAAAQIWQALGDVRNYVEPFAGSLATLLRRPHAPQLETVNDKDAFLACVWRAIQAAPDEVASYCDRPPNEADLHAVHAWLVPQREIFTAKIMGDPDYYDAKVAGRWLYSICCWIGAEWCGGTGPWQSVDGQLTEVGNGCRGVFRQLPHVGNAGRENSALYAYMHALQSRLRFVRVCCGDWRRVLRPSVTIAHGCTGILFDPPYAEEEGRDPRLYAIDDLHVAHTVRAWCEEHGSNRLLRIVLCGYGTTHDALLAQGWRRVSWTANGGAGNLRHDRAYVNRHRETLWLSPQCLHTATEKQLTFFA